MGSTAILAAKAYRAFAVDGNPASGPNPPDKSLILAIFSDADGRLGSLETSAVGLQSQVASNATAITTLQAGQASASRAYPSWGALLAVAAANAGDRAQVFGDGGTHTDPVTGSTVQNTGVYGWSTSPAGWQWLSAPVYQAATLTNVLSSDGLAYTAAAPVAIGADSLLFFTPPIANAGPVSLNVSGTGLKPVTDAYGRTLAQNALDPTRRYVMLVQSSSYLLPEIDGSRRNFADVVTLDAQGGWIDPDGRALFVVTPNGAYFEAIHPAAMDLLALDLYPGAGRLQSFFGGIVGTAHGSRRLNATVMAFSALIESPDDWQPAVNGRLGMGTGKRAGLGYRMLMAPTQSPPVIMRCPDNPGPVNGLFGVGNSNAVGVNGQVARTLSANSPACSKYQAFGFNAYLPFPTPGGTARGVGSSILVPTNYVDLAPLYEGTQSGTGLGETFLTGMAAAGCLWTDQQQRAPVTYFAHTWGAAGQEIATVLPTTTAAMWNNGVSALKRAIFILALYGRWMVLYEHVYIGGHQDRSAGPIKTTADAAAGATVLQVSSTSGGLPAAYIGQSLTGTGIAPGTTLTAANRVATPYTITLSAGTTAAIPSGTTLQLLQNVPVYMSNLTAFWQGVQSIWLPLLQAQNDPLRSVAVGSLHPSSIQLLLPQLEAFCWAQPAPLNGTSGSNEIGIGQADWVRANMDKGRMSHPRYMLLHGDDTPLPTQSVPNPTPVAQRNGEHISPLGQIFEGEMLQKARFLEAAYRAGTRTYPQAALGLWYSVTRSGTTVTFSFFVDQGLTVPWGGLAFDTTTLANSPMMACEAVPDGNFGFAYSTATITAPPTIGTSAAAAALGLTNDQVSFQISSPVAGVASYATVGPGSTKHASSWGNLRASDASFMSSVLPGVPLYDWCLMLQGSV